MAELRILLLDDRDPGLEGLVQALSNGHAPRVRRVGALADLAAALRRESFDLALGAESLPGPDGKPGPVYPALAEAAPDLPFVALAPPGDHARGLAAVQAGASDYVSADDAGRLAAVAARARRDAARQRECARARRSEGLFRAYFRHLFEHSPEAIVLLDHGLHISDVNSGFSDLFGYAREEVLGRTLDELIVPENLQEEYRSLYSRMNSACTVLNDTIRMRKDGSPVRVQVIGCPISTADGGLGFYAIYTDLTSRQKVIAALRQSESNYRSIFLNASEGMYVSTPTGRFVTVNPALAELLGYDSPGDLADNIRNIGREIYTDPAHREEFISRVQSEGRVVNFRTRVRRKDGRIIEVLENARAVRDDDDELLYYQGTVLPAPAQA